MKVKVEEVFQSKTKRSQVSREWEESERSTDPLIEYWIERKKERFCKERKE